MILKYLLVVLFGVCWLVFMIFIFKATSHKKEKSNIDTNHVNQNSFQRYAKFYGEIYPNEENFDYQLNKIYTLIESQKMTDIQKIAELSACTIPECVLKIRYLKNKRLLGDYFIDTVQLKLLSCSPEDQALLEKYKPFI